MVCDKCGHELEDGQVYCPKCGGEIQLVANYNPTEEEIMGFDMKLVAPDISQYTNEPESPVPEKKSPFEILKDVRILAAFVEEFNLRCDLLIDTMQKHPENAEKVIATFVDSLIDNEEYKIEYVR